MPISLPYPDKIQFIQDYQLNSVVQLTEKYNVSAGTIRKWRKLFNLSAKKEIANFVINDIIGSWKIIEKLTINKFGSMRWKVQCITCGKVRTGTSGHIIASKKSGKTCLCNILTGYKEISGKYWTHIVYHAYMRGITFDISIIEAWDIFIKQERLCRLSKQLLHFGSNQNASFDRIDSSLHYTTSNVQWLDKNVNLMKNKLYQDNFIQLCKLIANNN